MKGVLYIIPADPKAIRERCEITAPPTIEELRKIVGGYIESCTASPRLIFTAMAARRLASRSVTRMAGAWVCR
jgi:hypothetical protein